MPVMEIYQLEMKIVGIWIIWISNKKTQTFQEFSRIYKTIDIRNAFYDLNFQMLYMYNRK